MNALRMTWMTALTAVVLSGAAVIPAFAADSGTATPSIFQRGSQWMSGRVGYAKATGDYVADGMMGFGFGYRRFVVNYWSVAAFVHYDILGRYDRATDIEVPLTLEVARHTHWGNAFYPYLGFGAGAFYRKYSRTGADFSGFTPGRYVTLGAHTPIHGRGLLGLDLRMASVDKPNWNPSFDGPTSNRLNVDGWLAELQREQTPGNTVSYLMIGNNQSKSQTIWSIKLDYTITY